jgi:TonB-dependent SusC/RagA subfamily outer membrane receptor
MQVIVDGTPQYDAEEKHMTFLTHNVFDDFSPGDIESIEILLGTHGTAIYGSIASGGAIIITTKRARGINNYYKESPGVITFKANGFHKAREFYSPKYSVAESAVKKDSRTTIYWNPEIIADKNGFAQFDYYDADAPGNYKVVVEGIDAEGNLGRQVFRYKVE